MVGEPIEIWAQEYFDRGAHAFLKRLHKYRFTE